MPISLAEIKKELYPGLAAIEGRYCLDKEIWAAKVFNGYAPSLAAPHIWVPKLTLPEAALVGAAAAIITNPPVTRRFWKGWFA